MPDAPLLDVRDLAVSFSPDPAAAPAVAGVSFTLERGRTLALVGESGSGKSVTALSIVRLLPPGIAPGGQALFDGEDLLKLDEARLRAIRGARITMVFQEPMTSLNPLHTIEKQIGEILELHGVRGAEKIRARVVELLEEVGIPDPAERLGAYPHQLSGGQRQRVMIAMALANRPDLFIADEPTTALDVTVQAQILDLLKRLQARHGMAMLFITHDLNIVRKIADDVAVMQKGRIVETGPVARIFAEPSHPYTRALLAAEPKGAPPLPVAGAKPVVVAENVRVWFPIKRGFFRRTVGYIKAVDDVSVTVREGETVGVVGEFGIGQDDARPCAFAPHSLGRGDRLSRPAHRRAAVQGAAPAQGRHADRVSGPLRLAVAAHVGRRHRRRGPRRAEQIALLRKKARDGRARALRYGPRSRRDGPLPA